MTHPPLYTVGLSLTLLLGALCWTSCQNTANTPATTDTTTAAEDKASDRYLPALWSGVRLGDVKNAVLGARPKANRVNTLVESTYETYTEDVPGEPYTSVYYDFSRVEPQQLVRLRLLHRNLEDFKETVRLFGGTVTDNANSIYTRTLSDQSVVYAKTTNREVMYYLPDHDPAASKTRER